MKFDMRGPIIAAMCVATLLTSCTGTIPVPTTVVTAGMPNPEEALRQSMQHVDAEMAELGGMRAETVQTAAPASAAQVMPEDLQRVVSFTWTGSLDKGVAKLAQSIGYTFYTTAAPNTPPLNVAVQVQQAPAFEVFKALGDEAGDRATVEVDPLHHQVQVIHHV
jgi:defect-in-organelle-trafficking protein DotD